MVQEPVNPRVEGEAESLLGDQFVHAVLRFILAVRYRKNVVVTTMAAAILLGVLYYATATRFYSAKAEMLISQTGSDQLNTSMTSEESLRRNSMPTFESMIRSAKVVEGALAQLGPEDLVDLGNAPREQWVALLQAGLSVKTVRGTSILQVSYSSRDPQVAVRVVRAVVQSYLDFMETIHKGTTGEIRDVLVKERGELAGRLAQKQDELLEARRHFADMGFRSDGKTLHPLVQRTVFFNDALIAGQKQRLELEASQAALEAAIRNGEDLAPHLLASGDAVGRELLLSSLGVGARDTSAQVNLEQNLVEDRARLATIERSLGPAHPEVIAVRERIAQAERFLEGYQERLQRRIADLRSSALGPWLLEMVRQRRDEARQKEAMLETRFEETRSEAIDLSGQLAKIEMLERDVKRLCDMNDVLLNQIASLDLRQNGQEVRVAVIHEPIASERAISPRLGAVAVLCVFSGFGIGLLLVHLLDTLDDRFRSVEEVESRLGVSVLAMVRQMPPGEAAGLESLVMCAAPTSAESEPFRTLRTALNLGQSTARQIVISSAEPGDGKTTVLANLAIGYAQSEKKTLLVDADLRRPGLTGLSNMRGPHGLSQILQGSGDVVEMAAAHVRASEIPGLDILPSGPRPTNPAELLASAPFLAVTGLGRDRLRSDPHRQSARAGHERYRHDRPPGRWGDSRRPPGQEPPPPGGARNRQPWRAQDPGVGRGREPDPRPGRRGILRLRLRVRRGIYGRVRRRIGYR